MYFHHHKHYSGLCQWQWQQLWCLGIQHGQSHAHRLDPVNTHIHRSTETRDETKIWTHMSNLKNLRQILTLNQQWPKSLISWIKKICMKVKTGVSSFNLQLKSSLMKLPISIYCTCCLCLTTKHLEPCLQLEGGIGLELGISKKW